MMDSIRGRSCSVRRTENAAETRRRKRVWSGGSTTSMCRAKAGPGSPSATTPPPVASAACMSFDMRESFNAAHQLWQPELSDDENRHLFGKCANLHGHNYALDVVVSGEIDPVSGYVLDLKLLSDVVNTQVIQEVDHHNLNTDVPWLKGRIPTTENLAQAFWERLQPELPDGLLHSIRLWETDKNWAEVGETG